MTLVDLGLYTGLTHLAGMEHWVALGLSFIAGIVVNFSIARAWAFQTRGGRWHRQFFRFLLVAGVMYLVNGWLMQGLYEVWPLIAWRNFWVRGVSAMGTLPLSYYLLRRFTFREGPIFSRKSLPLKIR